MNKIKNIYNTLLNMENNQTIEIDLKDYVDDTLYNKLKVFNYQIVTLERIDNKALLYDGTGYEVTLNLNEGEKVVADELNEWLDGYYEGVEMDYDELRNDIITSYWVVIDDNPDKVITPDDIIDSIRKSTQYSNVNVMEAINVWDDYNDIKKELQHLIDDCIMHYIN